MIEHLNETLGFDKKRIGIKQLLFNFFVLGSVLTPLVLLCYFLFLSIPGDLDNVNIFYQVLLVIELLLILTCFVVLFYIIIKSYTRRLHDIGYSGWWYLVLMMPFVGFIAKICLIGIIGDSKQNRYGDVVEYIDHFSNKVLNNTMILIGLLLYIMLATLNLA